VHCANSALFAAASGSGSGADTFQLAGRSARCNPIAVSRGVGEWFAAGGALLGAGALLDGAFDGAAEAGAATTAAGTRAATGDAEPVALLLHPASTTETDTAMATEGQIRARGNFDIDQQSATDPPNWRVSFGPG
jgi:hypothetical protein